MTVFYILIDAVHVVNSPSAVSRGAKQVDAEAEVWFFIMEHAHDRWQYVDLLGNFVLHLRQKVSIAWLIYNNR